jgi:hypothetical protein
MVSTNFQQVACYLTPEQHAGLKRLSDETLVPMQIYIRYAITELLMKHNIMLRSPAALDEIVGARITGRKKGARR